MKHKNNCYELDLQMFADEGEAGEGNAETAGEAGAQQKEEKTFTQEEMNAYFKERLAREKEAHQKELEAAKAEAAKLAKMNEAQKQQYELEKEKKANEDLNAKVDELTKKLGLVELGKTATNILREHDIEATEEILDFVVGADAETTKANIDKFVKIVEAQVKKAELARATGTTPRSYNNNGNQLSEIDKRIAKYQ